MIIKMGDLPKITSFRAGEWQRFIHKFRLIDYLFEGMKSQQP